MESCSGAVRKEPYDFLRRLFGGKSHLPTARCVEQLLKVLNDVDSSAPVPKIIKWCGACRVDLGLIFSMECRPSPRKQGKYTKVKRPPRLQQSAFQYVLWKREKNRSKEGMTAHCPIMHTILQYLTPRVLASFALTLTQCEKRLLK